MFRYPLLLAAVLAMIAPGRFAAAPELRIATFRCDVTPPVNSHPLIWLVPMQTAA
jgi:hypothetical protein